MVFDLTLTFHRLELCSPCHKVRDGKEHFLEKSFAIIGFNCHMVKLKVVVRCVYIESVCSGSIIFWPNQIYKKSMIFFLVANATNNGLGSWKSPQTWLSSSLGPELKQTSQSWYITTCPSYAQPQLPRFPWWDLAPAAHSFPTSDPLATASIHHLPPAPSNDLSQGGRPLMVTPIYLWLLWQVRL